MKKLSKNKIIVLAVVNLLFILAVAGCLLELRSISSELLSQKAADRWQGESDAQFSQVSVYFPEFEAGPSYSLPLPALRSQPRWWAQTHAEEDPGTGWSQDSSP